MNCFAGSGPASECLDGIDHGLQDSSGGNFQKFLHKESSGRILYCAILMINITVSEIIELSTTTVLKPTISPNPLAGLAGRTDADTPFSLSVAAT